jgi:hypothetical protein
LVLEVPGIADVTVHFSNNMDLSQGCSSITLALKKEGERAWTGFIWLRIEASSGLL